MSLTTMIDDPRTLADLVRKTGTPCFVYAPWLAAERMSELRRVFSAEASGRVDVAYAVKANPDPEFLSRLASTGCHFDVASSGEFHRVIAEGVTGERMVYSGPGKRREEIASSFAEIEKGNAAVLAQKQQYDKELENIEETRRSRIQEAAHDAEKLAAEIKEEARREAVGMRDKAKQDIAIELEKANEVLKDRMIEAILTATEKIIKERLDRDKHNKLIGDVMAEVD